MEVDLGDVQAVDASSSLAVVDGGGDVVDGEAVGGEEGGDLQQLVEVALAGKWDCDHCNLVLFHGGKVFDDLVVVYLLVALVCSAAARNLVGSGDEKDVVVIPGSGAGIIGGEGGYGGGYGEGGGSTIIGGGEGEGGGSTVIIEGGN